MIFSVVYRYRKSRSIIKRVIYIYIYIEFLTAYIRDPSRCFKQYESVHFWSVGDRKRVRNTVMLIYCNAMGSGLQKYVSIWTSFWIFPPVLVTAHVSDCAIKLTKAGSQSGKDIIMIIDGKHTWQQCSATILEDILSTKYDLDLR